MADEREPTCEMLGSIAAQLMILYDDAMANDRPEAAEAYAMALNVVRNETNGVKIFFGGPPPTLRTVPRTSFPERLEERLAPLHRPSKEDAG